MAGAGDGGLSVGLGAAGDEKKLLSELATAIAAVVVVVVMVVEPVAVGAGEGLLPNGLTLVRSGGDPASIYCCVWCSPAGGGMARL